MIILREALYTYDSAQTEKDKAQALGVLKKYASWNHDFYKPSNLKKIAHSSEEKKGNEGDTSEEEDEQTRNIPTNMSFYQNLFDR
jgi:hypothetical protein